MSAEFSDRIARRAYDIWENEGRPEGRSVDHWLAAEREVGGDSGKRPAPAAKRPSAGPTRTRKVRASAKAEG